MGIVNPEPEDNFKKGAESGVLKGMSGENLVLKKTIYIWDGEKLVAAIDKDDKGNIIVHTGQVSAYTMGEEFGALLGNILFAVGWMDMGAQNVPVKIIREAAEGVTLRCI